MKLVIFLSLLSLAICSQFESYEQYLVFASKNHIKSVSQYAESIGVKNFDEQWEQFKTDFDRHYETNEEEELRKFNFLKNLQFIESHNEDYKRGVVSHEVGVNQFSDWTSEEYNSMLGVTVPDMSNVTTFEIVEEDEPEVYASLPSYFDWRDKHKVTGVKNQAQCGSCWAFATTAVVESAILIHKNKKTSLSEQMLVDCSPNNGCNGGNPGIAMQFIKTHGIESEKDYKYHAKRGTCKNSKSKHHLKIKGWRELRKASDSTIKNAIRKYGPVAVMIDASGNDFMYHKTGIIRSGGKNINHVVTAIGWGKGYWIIKNSWGTNWGHKGFAQIGTGNVRAFNQFVYFPQV